MRLSCVDRAMVIGGWGLLVVGISVTVVLAGGIFVMISAVRYLEERRG